jgi:hypothetical protein
VVNHTPVVSCGTSPVTGNISQWIPIGTNATSDGTAFLWSQTSPTGSLQNAATLNNANYLNTAAGTFDATLTAQLLYGNLTCSNSCVVQVNVQDTGACANPPGAIKMLRASKDTANHNDIHFQWTADANSGSFRAYSVDSTAKFPPRLSNPLATPRCSTADGVTVTCTDIGDVPNPPAGLFYQVLGVCKTNANVEGPN